MHSNLLDTGVLVSNTHRHTPIEYKYTNSIQNFKKYGFIVVFLYYCCDFATTVLFTPVRVQILKSVNENGLLTRMIYI